MATSDFDLPVSGVSGTAFRNNLDNVIEALASTNLSASEPPTVFEGMLQVYTGGDNRSLRVRSGSNTWVTLLPNIDVENGGVLDGLELDFTTEAEVNTIVDNDISTAITDVITPLINNTVNTAVNAAVAGSVKIFNTYSRAPDLNTTDVFLHGLSVTPAIVDVRIKFRENVAGYDVGQEILLSDCSVAIGATDTYPDSGISVRVDSSVIQTAIASRIPVVNRSTNVVEYLTSSSQFEIIYAVYRVSP